MIVRQTLHTLKVWTDYQFIISINKEDKSGTRQCFDYKKQIVNVVSSDRMVYNESNDILSSKQSCF